MNNKRVFYVVHFADPFVQSCLDLVRYLAEWSEKTPAHITVRGPYNRRLPKKTEQSMNEKIAGVSVDVLGVFDFFDKNQSQNTVYLRCSAPELSQVWHKPDYPFNPHITLYDGVDREFANDLLAGLSSHTRQFPITAKGVNHIVSVKGERALPTTRLSIEFACERLGISLKMDASRQDHRSVRLEQILRVYHGLQQYCKAVDEVAPLTTSSPRRPKRSRLCKKPTTRLPYRIVDRRKGLLLNSVLKDANMSRLAT